MTMNTDVPNTNPSTGAEAAAAGAPPVSPPAANTDQEALATVMLERLMPELMAIPVDDLIQVNVDIVNAATIVLGNLPEIRALRADIVKAVSDFKVDAIDRLEELTLALYESHGRYFIATKPRGELAQAIEEGTKLRQVLLADTSALTTCGLIDQAKFSELLRTVGHKNLAMDLNILYQVLKESWPAIQGKCALTMDEIEHAMRLSQRIMRLVGLRDEGNEGVAEASDVRTRCFTLFVNAYDEVQRGVACVRWHHGDTNKIAPPLYPGRSARRQNAGGTDPTQVPGGTPSGGASANTAGGTSAVSPAGGGGSAGAPGSAGAAAGAGTGTSEGVPSAAGGGPSGSSGGPGGQPFLP
jgi:hypothetical protein